MRHSRAPFCAALLFIPVSLFAEQEGREGVVQFSNGETLQGRISLTSGRDLKIHQDEKLMTLELGRVREIRFAPEKEEMEQKWRFPVAGQAIKEKWGDPYPTRHIKATFVLAGNEQLTGHLYTTVFYVEGPEKTEKIIVLAKQRGQQGETLESLVYPTLIQFHQEAIETAGDLRVEIRCPEFGETTELAGLTHGALARLAARKADKPNEYFLPSALGEKLFLSVRSGNRIFVGWPSEKPDPLYAKVEEALKLVRDFFDRRTLLGVFQAQGSDDVYALLLLARAGQTTLDSNKSQPWSVAVLRWKYQADEDRLMLAGRGYLFRGISGKELDVPEVNLCKELWTPRQEAEKIIVKPVEKRTP